MNDFVSRFFTDPIVGLLALVALALMAFLAWSEVKERRSRRQAAPRRRSLQDSGSQP